MPSSVAKTVSNSKTMDSLGIEMARSEVAYSVDEALAIADKLGYPLFCVPLIPWAAQAAVWFIT